MKKPSSAFYAVRAGRQTGVFLTWSECEEQIKGFNGARYKKFSNAAEAEAFATGNSITVASPTKSEAEGKGKKRAMPTELEDETGWDVVYSDGACKGNGKKGSVAGIGVWWGNDDPRNMAERCPGDQTNNRAELIAIVRILETTPESKTPLLIKSDSKYSMDCFSLWLPKWRQNGFKTATGTPVKNAGVIRYLSALLDARALYGQKVHFQYVKGHSGVEGNEGADAQANQGAMLPAVPERDWDALEVELREQMEIEQATRSDDQPVVPMEVEADDSSTGNAVKARKVSEDGSPLAPAGHEGSPPGTMTSLAGPFDSPSTPDVNTPPPAAPSELDKALSPSEPDEPPSPLKAKVLPAQQFDVLSTPKARASKAAESMSLAACSLPRPGFAGPSTPRKAAASTSRTQAMIAALRSPSSTVESNPADPTLTPGPATVTLSPGKLATAKSKTEAIIAALRTPTKRSPRRAAPSSKVASVLRTFVPSKSTSTEQQTNASPSKAALSPTKMQSRIPIPLARSSSKTVYSKEPPASSSSLMAPLTEADESQPSQGTQSTIAESFVTAFTTIIPSPIDAPSIEPAHASHVHPPLSEQPAMDVSPNDPTKIVVNKEDIDFSMYADCLLDEEDVWKDLDP